MNVTAVASEYETTSALAFRRLTILPGQDKSGTSEPFSSITLERGDLVALVGPTGSGKSRLLADIEWLARGDTPSKRRILLDDREVTGAARYATGSRLVAQLSQTMAFMVDLAVEPFLRLHAESRGHSPETAAVSDVVANVLKAANDLAGESFSGHTPLSRLSGGQSRALMIADTALLCQSPIVLVDEIENAGIDRRRALDLLLSHEKLVIIATHDPLLALQARRRFVIQNGGVSAMLRRSDSEVALLAELENLDWRIQSVRTRLRAGEPLL
ncbi:MAG TPA: ATP-binding cassette domain-containing protein [Polyangiaceae bacterium]